MSEKIVFKCMRGRALRREIARVLGVVLLTMIGSVAGRPAHAQIISAPQVANTAEGAFGIEEVLVTARRRVENLQTVPGAISVVNAETLDRAYAVNTQAIPTSTDTKCR